MMSEHWPRGTLVTRLYERDSLALSLIRSSGETRAHRSPSARPAILTVRRLLYSNGFLPPFSSAEFCSAYQSLPVPWWSSCRGGRPRRTSITFVLPPCATTYSLRHIHRFLTLLPPGGATKCDRTREDAVLGIVGRGGRRVGADAAAGLLSLLSCRHAQRHIHCDIFTGVPFSPLSFLPQGYLQ